MLLQLLTALILGAIAYRVLKWYRGSFISDFTKKRVFVTGTDSGFGRRLAIDLDRRGLVVYAGCYTEDGTKELSEATSSRLRVIRLDITDPASVQEALRTVQNDLPTGEGLWGLVNNAGTIAGICFDFSSLPDYEMVMGVNFFGQIRVTEAFLPLVKRARGRIVTVNSALGRGSIMFPAYSCSKYALQPYCDGLRRAMRTFGVHSAIIEPGFFPNTGITTVAYLVDQLDNEWDKLPGDTKKEYGHEFKARFLDSFLKLMECWPFIKTNTANLQFVTDDIQHALGAVHPKDRYRCGSDALPCEIITNVLPDWVLDPLARYIASYKDVASKI